MNLGGWRLTMEVGHLTNMSDHVTRRCVEHCYMVSSFMYKVTKNGSYNVYKSTLNIIAIPSY